MQSGRIIKARIRRAATLAVAVAATTLGLAAPTAAAPATARAATDAPSSTAIILPKPWQTSLGEASASGTVSYRQDPLGVMAYFTVKGIINAPADGNCYLVRITRGTSTWESPVTCGPAGSEPFVHTFSQPIFVTPQPTARLCTVRATPQCGTPVGLW